MKCTLFTIGCPSCNVLEAKLDEAGVQYEKVTDMNVMRSRGFLSAPMLEVDGEAMTFRQAMKWLSEVCTK